MIFFAFLLASQASGAAQAPPPPPVMTPKQERQWLDAMPLVQVRGRPFRVFAIEGTGVRTVLESAAKKLTAEGWKCIVLVDHAGVLKLAVFATGRSLDDVGQLAKRFEAHEFGAIEARPVLSPDRNGS